MPNDFSQDGAVGAGGGTPSASGTQGTFGAGVPHSSNAGGAMSFFGVTPPAGAGLAFAEGGAIDEDPNADDPQGSAMGNQLQQSINAALGTVDKVLSYGRQLHGLDGDDSDSGAIKTADAGYTNGRMPSVPGNQSNSGAKPIQPMPGPLPPTSNPFGKRADASGGDNADQGSDDQDNGEGAIPTEEETA